MIVVLAVLAIAAVVLVFALNREEAPAASSVPLVYSSGPSEPESEPAASQPVEVPEGVYQAMPLPEEMRAMYYTYLEWEQNEISSEAAMRATVAAVFDNCVDLGMNTVLMAVRPYSDALYQSEYFPWSHLVAGTQGQDPGFDPLQVMIEEAHSRGLRIEAYINPYRVQVSQDNPALAANNPAAANPDWVRTTEAGTVWYDPGHPEVRRLLVESTREIVEKYDVDGIHFDDYFYGATGEDFDAATYAEYGNGEPLDEWRRNNINEAMMEVNETIKAANPSVSFGISPQGNNENNYNQQYSDIALWLSTPGYVDYIMPQLYWGFNYNKNGNESANFANKTAEWAGYPRADGVRLYAALGAYRIKDGDGGDNDQAEWQSGHNLADMIAHLDGVEGFSGFSLFRYHFLYNGSELATSEVEAIKGQLGVQPDTE